jgi:hypothetical protein
MKERPGMPRTTYYVALPFVRDEEGSLVPGAAVECPSRAAALARAGSLARSEAHAGAIAFSRLGDLEMGDFDPAEVLTRIGDVPEDLSEL